MSEDKKDEDEKPDFVDPFAADRSRENILLWGGLLMIPLAAGIFYAVTAEEVAPREKREVVEEVLTPMPVSRQAAARKYIQGDELKHLPTLDEVQKNFPCKLESWVGQKMTEIVEKRIKVMKHPYRLLPPGSMMTQDFNPARYNFELDANNVIVKTWCG